MSIIMKLLFFSSSQHWFSIRLMSLSVIRELGSMKQQFRFFRRTSEADLTLQWIKECMENTKWWIRIQSSMVIEDDILDYALQYRRKENAGQIVLLSNDVTVKIKSMAKVTHFLDISFETILLLSLSYFFI